MKDWRVSLMRVNEQMETELVTDERVLASTQGLAINQVLRRYANHPAIGEEDDLIAFAGPWSDDPEEQAQQLDADFIGACACGHRFPSHRSKGKTRPCSECACEDYKQPERSEGERKVNETLRDSAYQKKTEER